MHLPIQMLNKPLALLPGFALAPQRSATAEASGLLGALAIIPICGVLVHGRGDPDWGTLGYGSIRADFCAAMSDPSVAAVAFVINSPGGDVPGLFELADTIYEARGSKPIVSVLTDGAYSAAYCIAAAADMITVPMTGGTGSIGCVVVHADVTEMMRKMGVTTTIIRSGSRKMEENGVEPLSDVAKASLQADVDLMADMFIERVALFRQGKVTADQIRAFEARTFLGQQGVEAGLADAVLSPQDAIAGLLEAIA
ncbi:S49 family peptidase [Rhodopila sp.]|uniref:S49 family peptidase n=1 Tax=Rhodopila sp. TaxID=2480087 RepID=UPI003D0C0B65